MSHHYIEPIIGHWHKNRELTDIFEIVAIDEDDKLIEIQYFDGQIAEIDLDSWKDSRPVEVAEPEDFSGAYEIPKEDLSDYKDDIIHPNSWNNPTNAVDNLENDPDLRED